MSFEKKRKNEENKIHDAREGGGSHAAIGFGHSPPCALSMSIN